MNGLEQVYTRHHAKNDERRARKRNHAILIEERSSFIRKYLGNGKNVLDIGCRDGELIKYYNQDNRYQILGLDIDSEALEIARQKTGIQTRWCDLNSDWSIEPNSLDGVVACEVIEHLYYPEVVLEKIYSALRPGGTVVGSIPHAFNIQTRLKLLFGIKTLTPLSDPTHINHFSSKEFISLLEKKYEQVEVVGITTPRYAFLKPLFPYLLAHTLLFKGVKNAKSS
jgi:2-polyprenyl-3-methyl-5-hydroxy-6-metoxy-1,4-benzoquinol methylase